jgi:hypothetical protein
MNTQFPSGRQFARGARERHGSAMIKNEKRPGCLPPFVFDHGAPMWRLRRLTASNELFDRDPSVVSVTPW